MTRHHPHECQIDALLQVLGYPDPRTYGPIIAKCKADAADARHDGRLALASFHLTAAAALEMANYGGDGGDPAQHLAAVALDLLQVLTIFGEDLVIAKLA